MSRHNDIHAAIQKLLSDHEEYYPHFLEQRFPHVLQRVISLWGSKPEVMAAYLDSLLAPPRNGAKGFPQEATFEIVTLKAVHRASFPEEVPVVVPQLPTAPPPVAPPPVDEEEDEAALVFARMHRR